MTNQIIGELNTKKTVSAETLKLGLFNHYLNHKVNSENTVIENIIISFNKKYKPEKYLIKSNENSKSTDDSLKDIRSVAHLIVWEATEKYLWGVNSKTNFQHQEKFNFCIFASEQVKYKLRTHLRLLNTNRICGKLPDSDSTRYIYSKIPKYKLNKKFLTQNDYKSIARENNVKIDEVKLIDKFVTTKTESGDEEIKDEDDNKDNENKWDRLNSDINLEDQVNKSIIIKRFNKIKDDFLKDIPLRDKEILNSTKLSELNFSKETTLAELGKKFDISPERVRQIAERNFNKLKKVLIKNKKDLEIN